MIVFCKRLWLTNKPTLSTRIGLTLESELRKFKKHWSSFKQDIQEKAIPELMAKIVYQAEEAISK